MPQGCPARSRPCCPIGVRPRQLRVRTLFVGLLLAAADDRPAHLTGPMAPSSHSVPPIASVWAWSSTGVAPSTCSPIARSSTPSPWSCAPSQEHARRDAPPTRWARCSTPSSRRRCPRRSRRPLASLAVDWSDQETFARPPADQLSPVRRSRGLLGASQRRSGRAERALLRLFLLSCHHGGRRGRRRACPSWCGASR